MFPFLEALVVAQYGVTALSSAFNAGYFFRYCSPQRGRWVGAMALGFLSLALVVESLYFGLFAFFQGQGWSELFFLDPRRWLVARLLLCLGSLSISGLILRQWISRRGK